MNAALLAFLSVVVAQTAVPTPPGVPVPVPALFAGPDNILQWYQVLSSDASPTSCTALTNGLQTTDADYKPVTPWVLGKLSSGASLAAFNISVFSTDDSILVLRPLNGATPLQLKLVNLNTSNGITSLILTNANANPWSLVWMLSTNSSQSTDLYTTRWAIFNNALGPDAFPNQLNTVTQGPSCNYPPGLSPAYFPTELAK